MRTSDRATLITISAVIAGAIVFEHCSPPPAGPPTKVQASVTRHTISSVVDTVTVNRLQRERDAARQRELAAAAAERVSDSTAASDRRRADSLATVAAAAETARDSAEAWHSAYVARSTEADSLRGSLGHLGARLEAVSAQLSLSDSVAATWRTHALRGDSLIVQLVPLAERGSRCRILLIVACPSRKQAMIGGIIAGAAAGAIAVSRK